MLTTIDYTYFQPDRYSDDGTNIEYGGMPEELFSFQAFRTKEECTGWLINHGYSPEDFVIHEYHNNDIEDVTLLDENGDVIPKIEEYSVEEITELLTDEVLFSAGSIDNLVQVPQDGETKEQFMDRVYGLALDEVNSAITGIEEANEYDFSSYAGNPDVEWYDEARDEAVRQVMRWMLEENQGEEV